MSSISIDTSQHTYSYNSQNIAKVEVQSVKSERIPLVTSTAGLKQVGLTTGLKVSISDEQTVRKIERALKAMQGPETSFEMSMHEATNTVMIKVLNKETGELIREVPPEKTLDIVAKFMEINGLLVDKKV
jgi:flagellar protein FlaG